MNTLNADLLRYACFWPRFGALLLDTAFLLPLSAIVFWGSEQFRLFDLYYLVPGTLIDVFYSVYLVKRFGGTPGKLILGVRICKVTGEPVGYREAFLRYAPDLVLGLLMSAALLIAVLRMSDAEYNALSFMERSVRMNELTPSWYGPLQICLHLWIWGEFIVMLTNKKRRALHDFIAGTVVIHKDPSQTLQSTVTTPDN